MTKSHEQLQWFGDLPYGWQAKKVKYSFNLIGSGTTPSTGNDEFYEGEIPWVTTSELRENVVTATNKNLTQTALDTFSSLKIYQPSSLMVAMYGATIGRIGILGIPATVNQAVCVLSEPTKLNEKFAYYAFIASREFLQILASGGGQPNLNAETIKEHKIPCPSIDTQRRIAAYLDRETAHIDTLIAAKERLLRLLAEKRQALITRAVTRGLDAGVKMKDSGVKMKDSGVAWLGEVPEGWEVKQLRFVCKAIKTGGTPSSDLIDDGSEETINWYTPGDFSEQIILSGSKRQLNSQAPISEGFEMYPPDTVLVVGIGATLGKVGLTKESAYSNQQINALILKDDILSEYLAYQLSIFDELMKALANSATLPILNQQKMGDIHVRVPPFEEQLKIVDFIQKQTSKIDKLRAATERTITLLKERRSALIAAAVTGQIEIPES